MKRGTVIAIFAGTALAAGAMFAGWHFLFQPWKKKKSDEEAAKNNTSSTSGSSSGSSPKPPGSGSSTSSGSGSSSNTGNTTTTPPPPASTSQIGKTAKAAYSAITTYNADGSKYRNDYSTGAWVGTITNDKVLVYSGMTVTWYGMPTAYTSFKSLDGVGETSTTSTAYYEVQNSQGQPKYVKKSDVKT